MCSLTITLWVFVTTKEAQSVELLIDDTYVEAQPDAQLPSEPGWLSPEVAWREGYRAAGGPPAYENSLWRAITLCEGSAWEGYYGQNGYWTRAQFSIDTWYKVQAFLSSLGMYPDPDDPYQVGLGAGWWAARTNPYEQWPHCMRVYG